MDNYFVKEIDTSGKILRASCSICGTPLSVHENYSGEVLKELLLHCNNCGKTSIVLYNQQSEIQAEEARKQELMKQSELELKKVLNL